MMKFYNKTVVQPDLSRARMMMRLHQAKNKMKRTPCFTLQTFCNKLVRRRESQPALTNIIVIIIIIVFIIAIIIVIIIVTVKGLRALAVFLS